MADLDNSFLPDRGGQITEGKSRLREMLAHIPSMEGCTTRHYLGPDGTKTTLRTHGGLPKVYVSHPEAEDDEEVTSILPDLISGVVIGGYYNDARTHVGAYRSTPLSAVRYDYTLGTLWGLKRLTVETSPALPVPMDVDLGSSQYAVIQPYKFSGGMRRLVQWMLGYGRPNYPTYYTDLLTLPESVIPTHPVSKPVQLDYDYRFNSSYGLTYGADGYPWVIWIEQARGVYAFRLPIVYGSDGASVIAAILDQIGDVEDELVQGVALYKGIPTGECMTASTLDAWVRSGAAIKLMDIADMGKYGACIGTAKQIGWAFNYAGTEARVIGLDSIEDPFTFYHVAKYMSLSFSIGACREPEETNALRALRAKYLTDGADAATRFKCLYMRDVDAYNVLNGHVSFDAVVVPPIASATCVFSEIESSPWVMPSAQVKIYDEDVGFCASAGVLFEYRGIPAGTCTAPIHVFYDNNDVLHEVRIKPVSGDTSGGPYFDLFDTTGPNGAIDRKETDTYRYTAPSSLELANAAPNDQPIAWIRRWWMTHENKVVTVIDNTTNGVVIVPKGDRESVIFAKRYRHNGGNEVKTYGFTNSTRDKIAYAVRENYVINTSMQLGEMWMAGGCSVPYGKTPPLVYSDAHHSTSESNSDPNAPGDGEWASGCAWYYGATYPNPEAGMTNSNKPVDPVGTFDAVAFVGGSLKTIASQSGAPNAIWASSQAWFDQSTFDAPQLMSTSANCSSLSAFCQCSTDINAPSYFAFGDLPMPCPEKENQQLNYIGVVL